jgi:DNA invertase Pin-like site-specific DNA recombinase
MNNAVIYARVSSIGDRQDTTRQVKDLTKYAKGNALNVVKTFEEHVSGAKGVDERPVLAECLQFCIDNHIDCLLLSELSRLGRNVWNVLDNIKWCRDHHLNVFFQKESLTIYDADGQESKLLPIMVSVLGMVAETERENIKFRLNSGRERAKANGVKMGRPVGATKSDEQLLKDHAKVVALLKQGVSIRVVAQSLNVSTTTVQKVKNALKRQ